jgi:dihydroorotase
MSTIFKNATIINPAEKLHKKGSVKLSENGVLEAMVLDNSDLASNADDQIIDFSDGIICSGLFDMHVHFREPGYEYKETLESGALAAREGGFTGVAIMPNTSPPLDTQAMVTFIKSKSANLAADIKVVGCITEGRQGKKIANYGELHESGVCALSDDGDAVMNSQVMRMAIEYATTYQLPLIQHCEDHNLSAQGKVYESPEATLQGLPGMPYATESIILARDLLLLKDFLATKALDSRLTPHYHVAHISSAYSLDLVRQAKKEGLPVTCEVTPHHFSLTTQDVYEANYNGNFCMNPPLADMASQTAILDAIKDGTIDTIASDHAPHAWHEKSGGIMQAPFGIVGLETAVGLTFSQLVHKKVISTQKAVEMLSTTPRHILGLAPITFNIGQPVNMSFIKPDEVWQVDANSFKSKSKNTPFDGWKLTGKAVGTCNNEQFYYKSN